LSQIKSFAARLEKSYMARTSQVINIRDWIPSISEDLIPADSSDAITDRLRVAFSQRMPVPAQAETTLADALRHLLSHSGSMVRPRIIYRLAQAYGFSEQSAADLAIALEYFHTASLVFDDLPCMDDASMRRGAACVHLAFGVPAAILAALALVNRAYALAWEAISECSPPHRKSAQHYLEQHLGVYGLLNGQSLDLNYSRLPHTLDSTERIAEGKTVSLISLTLVLPALAGGAGARELQLLTRLSTYWGLSYQIVDDLKDVLESSTSIGKTAARDVYLDRPNTAVAIGVTGAVERLLRLLRTGDRNLESLLVVRPSLAFLREFRAALKDELNRVIEVAGATPIDKKR
jgi:geranylgeranyl pyrophosphate synthase